MNVTELSMIYHTVVLYYAIIRQKVIKFIKN